MTWFHAFHNWLLYNIPRFKNRNYSRIGERKVDISMLNLPAFSYIQACFNPSLISLLGKLELSILSSTSTIVRTYVNLLRYK